LPLLYIERSQTRQQLALIALKITLCTVRHVSLIDCPFTYSHTEEEEQEENTELGDELEYELDHADELFLAALNERIKTRFAQSRQLRTRSNNPTTNTKAVKNRREKINATMDVTDDMLEQLIDGLEKEAFFGHGLRQIKDNTMDGMLCCVCNDHDGDDGAVLVLCDGCNMAAHQHCYGIYELPVATWLCARCVRRESNAVCVLCGGRYGGMKPTVEGQWVHVLCALWFPEISCKDASMRDPIMGIDKIHSDRWNKVCPNSPVNLVLIIIRCALYAMTRVECASLVTSRDARHNFMLDVRVRKVCENHRLTCFVVSH
jgi:hypothetical protein